LVAAIFLSLAIVIALWFVDWRQPRLSFQLSPMGVKNLIFWAIGAMIIFLVKC
jgi:hypothetical protein